MLIRLDESSVSRRLASSLFLRLQDIGKHYQNNIVLSGITFDLREHEILCLLGPSGCGKTTTLLIIAGVLQPDAGRVWICGKEVVGPNAFLPPEKRRVGFVFQDYALFPHLTVEHNVAFGVRAARSRRRARAMTELARLGIEHLAGSYPHMLSGGESQRVALARALASDPNILLLDEPFSNLDRQWREILREETADILRQRGAACVFVTHDPEEACLVGDRIVLIDRGRILQQGTPHELYTSPASIAAARFFGRINLLSGIVSGSKVRCGNLAVPAADFSDGERVEIAIRPEAFLKEAKDSTLAIEGYVRRVRSLGAHSQLTLAVDGIDELLTARPAAKIDAAQGSPCRLYLNMEHVHIFAKEDDEIEV